jgi:hypothetical protein
VLAGEIVNIRAVAEPCAAFLTGSTVRINEQEAASKVG